jgi:leucyl/phenylalanyl-tRNA--protein transferase
MSNNTPLQVPFWLDPLPATFPPSELALVEPDGLLAVGGDLTPEWLLLAYSKGIFPWFNPGEPILWWTPNPRSVLFIDNLKIRRSLRQTINKKFRDGDFRVSLDEDFRGVVEACSKVPRPGQDGTWITGEMLSAYTDLHKGGHAHSVEVWENNNLVGGLYGVAIGKMFYGESMFAKVTDASKIALVALAMQLKQWGFTTIDCQIETPHLVSLGAENIARKKFEEIISTQSQQKLTPQKWQLDPHWPALIPQHLQSQKS